MWHRTDSCWCQVFWLMIIHAMLSIMILIKLVLMRAPASRVKELVIGAAPSVLPWSDRVIDNADGGCGAMAGGKIVKPRCRPSSTLQRLELRTAVTGITNGLLALWIISTCTDVIQDGERNTS
jgi:hypothetical protein